MQPRRVAERRADVLGVWLADTCVLGLDSTSQTTINAVRTRELTLNLVDPPLVPAVDRLARLTGTPEVPDHKVVKGYRFCSDKFRAAGLTPAPSALVAPPRVVESRIQMEARVREVRPVGAPGSDLVSLETDVVRTYLDPDLLVDGSDCHVDPEIWDPVIMKFTHYYAHGRNVQDSALARAWSIPAVASPLP